MSAVLALILSGVRVRSPYSFNFVNFIASYMPAKVKGFPPRFEEWVWRNQGHFVSPPQEAVIPTPGVLPYAVCPTLKGGPTVCVSVCQGRANTKVRAEPPT